jgi:hypothetical protein
MHHRAVEDSSASLAQTRSDVVGSSTLLGCREHQRPSGSEQVELALELR